LDGNLDEYDETLASDAQVEIDLANPEGALLGDQFDMFTLDTTIIATGLAQLMDEGSIDASAKPFMRIAVKRQRHRNVAHYEPATLDAIARVVEEA
jgi:hypothetical protein